ncbi:MAG: thioredoxin [Acidobacteria bacterium]|nr:thioredoxin [Acidobacteriota bacterium]
MAIQSCPKCGAKNRVDERVVSRMRPVCGRCGAGLGADAGGVSDDAAAGGSSAGATGVGKPQVVTDDSFARDVLAASASQPVLLDCWAAWCGPCRIIAPVLDELAAESGGRYRVAKLNVDENKRTAAQFKIQSIPTLFIFKNGEVVERITGAQPKHVLAARLSAHL